VSSLAEPVWERTGTAEDAHEASAGEQVRAEEASRSASVEEEQIRALVQQLFFRQEFPPVRHVAFAAPDSQTDLGRLCLGIARVLAEDESRTVGVIDADPDSPALPVEMGGLPSSRQAPGREVAARLWAVPLEGWRSETDVSLVSDQNLYRLRQITAEFDFSLLRCPPAAWLTSRVAQGCDGVVLVLTANKTRRLVAAQMRDQLRSAGIPVLGTVLTGRRFPVPQGLYRNL
jgi:Mrp family chromosome partitioning ATPase